MVNSISSTSYTGKSTQAAAKTGKAAETGFSSALSSATGTNRTQDTVTITGTSKEQKLAALQQLHDQTDYSGMSDVEKVRLITDRFDAFFPTWRAYTIGLFGPLSNMNNFQDQLFDERIRQFSDAKVPYPGSHCDPSPGSELYREVYYSGMSDKEVLAAISQKYDGSMTGRACALDEYVDVVGGWDVYKAAYKVVERMRDSLYKELTGDDFDIYMAKVLVGLAPPSPFLDSKLESLAKNPNFAQEQLTDMISRSGNKAVDDALDELLKQVSGEKSEAPEETEHGYCPADEAKIIYECYA